MGTGGRQRTSGSEPTWVSYRDAVRMFLRGVTLPTATRIALLVGTWLSLMNQGRLIVDGHPPWVKLALNYLTPFTVAGHYVNDVVESGADVVRSIYGDAKYERLVGLKRTWDPENIFHLNQNVRP